jgi:predicted transcriptional regulator
LPPRAPTEAPPAWRNAATIGAALFLVLAPLLLYHRIRGPKVAQSVTRQRVLAILLVQPGANASDVARALRSDPSTAAYHLRRLALERLIVADGPPRRKRYFLAGSRAPHEREQVIAQRSGGDVLAAVREAPGLHKTRLAQRLSISRGAASWHLATLERAGLVRLERRASGVHVFPITF